MYLFFHFSFSSLTPYPLSLSSFLPLFFLRLFLILGIVSSYSYLVLSPLVQLSALPYPPLLPNCLRILVSLRCPE